MYTYSQLISRNMISTFILSVIFIVVAFFVTSEQVIKQQKSQHELVKLYFSTNSVDNIESLAKKLMQNQNFAFFKVVSADKQSIFEAASETNFLANVLTPKVMTQKISPQGLSVSIQTNASNYANYLLILCVTMLVLSLVFVFIAGKFSINRYKNIISSINEQIKHELTHVLQNTDKTTNEDLFDLPELNAGISEIKNQINNHISDAGALEKEAFIEPLTQLENRSRFVQFFETKAESIDFGVLTITRCSELQTINQIHGYTEGDNYICKVADVMKAASAKFQSSKIFRLNSSDFATILPNTTLQDAENYAKELTSQFNKYQQSSDLDSVGYTGLVSFKNDNPLGELLALADTGISVAQTQQINSWYSQTDSSILESSSASYGNQNWRQEIDNVIKYNRLTLLIQHIKPTSRNTKTYNEVLARFLNVNDEMLPTASFIAMAEKLDKIVEIDRMIIEKVISEIADKNLHDQHFGINVSSRTIHDEQFLIWLERRLLRDPAISKNLVFEITEFGLQQNIKTSKRFIDMIHRAGARVTVERFGVGLTSFKFFRDLKPDYIKMDSTYTRDIDEDKNNQYFLRLIRHSGDLTMNWVNWGA